MADCVFATTVTAFYADVENEIAMLAPKVEHHSRPIQDLKRLLSFQLPYNYMGNYGTNAILFVLGMLATYALIRAYRGRRHILNTMLFAMRGQQPRSASLNVSGSMHWLAILAYAWLCTPKRSRPTTTYAPPWWVPGWAVKVVKQGTHVVHLVHYYAIELGNQVLSVPVAPIRFADICNEGRALTAIHSTAKIVDPIEYKCVRQHGCTLFGVGLPVSIPVVSATCTHNERVAVNNRGLLDRPLEDPALWDEMSVHFDRRAPILESHWVKEGRLKVIKFDSWVKHFPAIRQACLYRARDALRSGTGKYRSMIKGFVKKEKVVAKSHPLALTVNGTVDYYDPRLIQGRHDDYQVLTGPVTYSATKYLAYLWHADVTYGRPQVSTDPRPRTPLVYTTGMNAEQLGEVVEFHHARLSKRGRVVCFEQDASRLDAHCNTSALKTKNRLYRRLRVKTRNLKAIERCMYTRGYTRHGIYYEVEATVQSGNGDTSSGDVIICIVPSDHLFSAMGVSEEEYFIMGTGDDNGTLMLEQHWQEYVRRAEGMWPRLGLKMEMLVMTNVYDLEFCSGRFYPTDSGVVFGPKIGRILVKTFYAQVDYTDDKGERWLKAVCLGLLRDTAFIPVLRALIPHVLSLVETRVALTIREEVRPHAMSWHRATQATWDMMHHLYDLSEHEILSLERWLVTSIRTVPTVINHPLINRILDVDANPNDVRRRSQVYPYGSLVPANFAALLFDPEQLSKLWAAFTTEDLVKLFILTVFSPTVEESVKRYWLNEAGRFLFPIAEYCINSCLMKDYAPFHRYMLSVGWRHWMWGVSGSSGTIGYIGAILMHSMWNFMVFAGNANPDLRFIVEYEELFFGFWLGYSLYRLRAELAFSLLWPVRAAAGVARNVTRMFGRAWNRLMHALNGNTTARSDLMELTAKNKLAAPKYTSEMYGPSHNPTHSVICRVMDSTSQEASLVCMTTASAPNKAAAEEAAAHDALPRVRSFIENLEARKKEAAVRETLMIGAGELTDKLSKCYPWSYALVDADNISPPRTKMRVSDNTRVFLVGTQQAIEGWTRLFPLPASQLLVVPPGPDSADNALVERLGLFEPQSTIVFTKDRKLIDRIFKHGPYVVSVDFETVQFNVNGMSAGMQQELVLTLVKYSTVPDYFKCVRFRLLTPDEFTARWKATL